MISKTSLNLGVVLAFAASAPAVAGPCDYKPSILAGKAGAAISSGVRQGAAAAVNGAKAGGHYVLVNPTSGLTLLSTATSSASGVAAGASGVVTAIGTILMAPVSLTVGAVTFGAAGAYEGLCYFSVDRVTDEAEVQRILEEIALRDPNVRIVSKSGDKRLVLLRDGEKQSYLLKKLYIADGVLKHRDWLRNSNLGAVAFVSPEGPEEPDAK